MQDETHRVTTINLSVYWLIRVGLQQVVPSRASAASREVVPVERPEARGRAARLVRSPSGQVSLDSDEVGLLRDAAAARAGRSSAARDLSLLLDRALRHAKPVILRRAELRTLIQIATIAHPDMIAVKLARSGDNAA